MDGYIPTIFDRELDELWAGLPAISLEGHARSARPRPPSGGPVRCIGSTIRRGAQPHFTP